MVFSREQYEESVFFKGEGRNGKGWLNGLLSYLLGTYMSQPALVLFTRPFPGGETPSPHVLALRGVRIVAVTETEAKSIILSSNYKQLRDHSSMLSGRNLYKDLVHFHPHFGVMFATNIPISFTSMDGGVLRSITVMVWPFSFCSNPKPKGGETNERQIDVNLKKDHAQRHVHAVQLLYLLSKLDKVMESLPGDSLVGPRPVSVQEATALFTGSAVGSQLRDFLDKHIGEAIFGGRNGRVLQTPTKTNSNTHTYKVKYGGADVARGQHGGGGAQGLHDLRGHQGPEGGDAAPQPGARADHGRGWAAAAAGEGAADGLRCPD